ncbi:MAG: alpha-2-macroglobulin family protein [Bacteroidota bacterium]
MVRYWILLLIGSSIVLGGALQSMDSEITRNVQVANLKNNSDSDGRWAVYDSLMEAHQPNAAREQLRSILNEGMAKNNHYAISRSIKSFIQTLAPLEPNTRKALFTELDSIVQTLPEPSRTLSSTFLVRQIMYRYRTWLPHGVDVSRVKIAGDTLSLTDPYGKAQYVFNRTEAISRDFHQLQDEPLSAYRDFLDIDEKYEQLLPTVFDFVAVNLIQFYQHYDFQRYHEWKHTGASNETWFYTPDQFSKQRFDEASLKHKILNVYKNLEGFHLEDTELLSAIYYQRLKYIFNEETVEDTAPYWKAGFNYFKDHSGRSKFLYELALLKYESGKNYHFKTNSSVKGDLIEARKLLKNEVDKFPESDFSERITDLIELIEQPRVDFQAQSTAYPGDDIPLKLKHQNVEELVLYIFEKPDEQPEKIGLRTLLKDDHYDQVRKLKLKVNDLDDYQQRSTEFLLDEMEQPGNYFLFATNTEEDFERALQSDSLWQTLPKAQHSLLVSEIMVTTEKNDQGVQFYVTDYKTGKPIEGARVNVYFKRRRMQVLPDTPNRMGKTDETGRYFAGIDRENIQYHVKYEGSEVAGGDYIYNYARQEPEYRVQVLTDRSIYRPGQTVHYKLVAYKGTDNDFEVADDESLALSIKNSSRSTIHEETLETNDYGSVNGSFTLPVGGPFGRFSVQVRFDAHSGNSANGSHQFRVEEYKRPTFEATIKQPTTEAKLDDSVSVKGLAKAFAGYPITAAKVNYKIYRNWNTYWRYFGDKNQGRDLMVDSVLSTDENGEFNIGFFAETDPNAPENANYSFEIVADVVDVSGETHEATTRLNLSKTGLALRYSGPQELRTNEEEHAVYKVVNMSSESQPDFKGKVEVYKVEQPQRFLPRIWSESQYQKFDAEAWKALFPYAKFTSDEASTLDETLQKTVDFHVEDSLQIKALIGDQQGTYRLNAYTVTKKGDTIRNSQTLKLIDIESKEVPEKSELWTYQSHQTIEVGESVEFQVGSSFKNARAFVQLRRGEEVIKEEWLNLKNRQVLCYTATEEDRGGISYHVSMNHDGKHYTKSHTINIPRTNKLLSIEAETFRDQLLPGQEEEWRFTISGEGADQLAAEVCAGMYDASLDQFARNYWSLWPYRGNYYYPTWRSANSRSASWSSGQGKWGNQNYLLHDRHSPHRMRIFGGLESSYFSRRNRVAMYRSTRGANMESSADMEEVQMVAEDEVAAQGNVAESSRDVDSKAPGAVKRKKAREDRGKEKQQPQIRENFNETAFFYPDLKTNEKNEFVVSFTLPESLTEWKFMALAHTKDMKTGSHQLKTTAQKPLMVTSNAPRFFRSGDQFDFASKVVNLTEEEQTVAVNLSFFNPANDKDVNLMGQQSPSKQVKIPAGASKEVVWNLDLSNQQGLIAYKITAANEAFRDGEQKPIPVLSNRQYVTEAMPFVATKKGVCKFSFDKLKNTTSSTLKHERVTLEYTSNPAWNAVLALPYLAEYPYECAEQIFSRYYANKLASDVIEQKPKIKAMFEEWRNFSPEVFMSELSKNEELKTILLEETPWVLDANDESEQKRRIAELFEVNQLARSQEKALHLLSKKQNSDGGFGWFGGKRSNIYITQHIVAGFGHLEKLGIDVPLKAKNMINEALSYMDSYHLRQYNKLTEKQRKEIGVSSITLHWLYASSYFSNESSQAIQNVKDHYHQKLQSDWSNFGLQQQAMAGLYFNRVNDEQYTKIILSSLRDRAKKVSDKGMYFPENNGGYYWNQAKIETQAMIIEFFADVEAKKAEIDALRLWLILQKRSNSWESTKATAMATYALLLNGTDYLVDDENPEIKVGKETIVFSQNAQENEKFVKATPGLGHFKTSWTGNAIDPGLGDVEIDKPTSTPSYGALYWSYFEDMSKVEASTNADISIKKTYRKVNAGSKGDEYVTSNTFEVGDRVNIELVVTVSQDMEYVHIKDLRPAGFEPKMALSQHQWKNGLWYYQSPRDVSMNYFIDRLPKGTHVLNYDVFVTNSGQFEAGNATVQCMYAPEFVAHSGGEKVNVKR